ncbi:hypothetical protein ACP70R_004868 [Stipagrostis hirtigluma subsp. patula]
MAAEDEGPEVEPHASSSPPSGDGPAAPAAAYTGATAGTRKRKSPVAAAAPKPKKPPKDYGTNLAYVYYGVEERDFECMSVSALRQCKHVVGELPQPRSMSLLDLQCWVIKLLRLHPETQDLEMRGFFAEGCPLVANPERRYLDWKTHYLSGDDSWADYVKKVKRRNGMEMFVLCVHCSEIKHYRSLFKEGYHAYSQVAMGADLQCMITQVLPGQDSLSSKWPAYYVYERLKDHPEMTTSEIVADLAGGRYDVQISHAVAWRVKQKAFELQFGTFYDAYNFVPRLLKDIKYNSRGNFVDIKDTEVSGCKDFRVLQCIFWAFAQCIQAFVSCRPVLCIKGTPLSGKYQGVLLTALALDANDNYIPVAFAVIEGESKESWLWFLKNVKQSIVKERPDVCIIHDYKMELIHAIEDLQNNCNRQEPLPWRDVQNRWCMEHLAENFLAHFGDKKLMVLFKRLCQQNQQSKFVKLWKELDELTIKYMAEKDKSASVDMQQDAAEHDETELEAQSPCNQLDSVEGEKEGNNDSGDSSDNVTRSFSEWIRPKSMEKWSLLHDTKGARYGIMGTKITDINDNYVLKGIECLPLTAMVEVTFQRIVEYFNNRSVASKKAIGNPSMNFPERVQDDMNAKMQKVQMHQVICMNTDDTISYFGEEDKKFKVQLKQRHVIVHLKSTYTGTMDKADRRIYRKSAECSCNKPKLYHKPCSHVIAVCCQIGVSTAAYISPYHSLSYLAKTWSQTFDVSDKTLKCFKDCRLLIPWETPTWIPDKKLELSLPSFLLSECTQTGMDEEEQLYSTENNSIEISQGTEKLLDEPSQV